VPAKPGPSLRGQWLGQRLRRLREARGLTLRQVATYLERDPSTVSRFESGEYPIRRADLFALLEYFKVHDPERQGLLTLREELWRSNWWDAYGEDLEREFADYTWLESRALRILSYDALALPGLTHTPQYAAAVIRQADALDAHDERLHRLVDLRVARQQVLDLEKEPRIQFTAVLDESALVRPVGGPAVMRDQLLHLLDLMGRSNIELRVLPIAVGWHEGFHGAFKLFELPEPFPDVAYVESLAGKLYIEQPDVERFRSAYAHLTTLAASPEESSEIINAIAEEMH